MDKVETYPMKKSPNRWAWRYLRRGKALCKSCGTFKSEKAAMKNFQSVRVDMYFKILFQGVIPNAR